ncbi:prohibitin family protein [Polyangium sp. 15x6]|uniref:prohibitin family protein n=1 Tax=Polyangium sp. 15x6 TaxID=3042687 RepID=UPI00249B4F5F|nr:prohibitin family protein [Polyangium sp. 15x6]MDI3284224.1 prohibitin family protein [Polyangium sp. 15x6]
MSDQEPQTQEPLELADSTSEGPQVLERATAIARHRFRVWLRNVQFSAYATLVFVLLALGFLWPRIFIVVPSGSHAVMYRFFAGGTVTNRVWGEGVNVIPPWDSLTIYETRLQQETLKFDVLSEEGLDLGVEVSIRYRPNKEMLGFLHQDIGTDYFKRLIKPEVEAHVRRTFGNRPAYEIYASSRDVLQELGQIPVLGRLEESDDDLSSRPYVIIQELKLVDIELPAIVESAIADKYKQEQLMLEYRYKLEREEKEAERKRTEAAGIRDYNIIASKLNPDVLRWRSIEATLELAKAPSSKVVVLGGGQGAQLLMNVEPSMGAAPAAPAAPAPPGTAAPPKP